MALLCLALAPRSLPADPTNGSLEIGTSVSHAYDARSVFTNPAALGFQTELNGTSLATSYGIAANRAYKNDYSLGISLGYLGFGAEELSPASETRLSRYTFAIGVPLFRPLLAYVPLYLGFRYVLNRSDVGALGSFDSADLGLQLRPSRFFSLGFMANGLNRPTVGGVRQDALLVLGTTIRPWDALELGVDIDSRANDSFLKQVGYQATVSYEILPGVKARVGYHRDYQWLGGFQINFGNLQLGATAQPSSGALRSVAAQLQATTLPFRSSLEPRTTYRLKIDSDLDEEGYRAGLFGRDRPSLLEVLEALEEARRQERVKVVVVKLDNFGMGLAAAQELNEALWRVRDAGKRVEVFLGGAGLREYIVASAATRIHMEPAGELKILGLRSQRYFVKGTLDKIGVEGEFLAKGEFKSAPEMFTRKDSSPVSRDATLEELRLAETEIIRILGRGRQLDRAKWKQLLEHAIFSADDALRAGLVDTVDSYVDELEKVKHGTLLVDNLSVQSDRLALPPRIAVLVANGDIMGKRVRLLSLGGESQVTPERFDRALRRAVSDGRTQAIVLRVNSPGGEVLASHQIAAAVERARREKPVIVSMGDVAASGGYYIAAPSDRIFARSLTLTGSIGVFLGKFNLGGLFKKLDLQKEILTDAPFAGIDSEDRRWNDRERAIMMRRLDQYYTGFVTYVASHRNLGLGDVEAAARGRVWLGEEARKRKLTDANGGYLDAIRYAADKAGISPDDYETWPLMESGGLFDLVGEDGLIFGKSTGLAELSLTLLGEDALRQLKWMARLRENPFLYWLPASRIE